MYAIKPINSGEGIPDPLTINRINVITISDVSTINGAPYVSGGGGGNVAIWSTCNAISTVNMATNDISGVKDLYVGGTSYIRAEVIQQTLFVSENIITTNLSASGLATLSGLTVNNNVGISNLLTTSGLTVNVSARVGGLRVDNNALIVGNLTISNLLTTSGLTVNNKLDVSGLTTLSGLTVNNNAVISNLLTTSGLTVNNNAVISNLLTTSGLTVNNKLDVSGLTTLSGLTVNNNAVISNLLTTSGLTVNNNATISNLLTTSGLTVNNKLDVSGLTTLSGLTVNNNAQIISNLSVGTINGFGYPYSAFGTGILRVDVCGNDVSGALSKYIYPFQTISAALSNAVAGNEVFVCPGTYNQSSTLVIPAGVNLRGANTNSVQIQNLGATNSFTLVEMLSNTRIEDVTLNLTSTATTVCGAQYVVVAMSGTNIPSIKLRTMVMNANNFNKGGNVYGVYASGNASTDVSIPVSGTTVRAATINVNTSGQTGNATGGSNARCIYSTGSNRLSTRDTNCFLTGTNCSSATLYGCETTVSGSWMDLQSSAIAAATAGTVTNCSVAEISQTNSNSVITLGATHLLYHSANGKGFSTIKISPNVIYGVFDTGAWSAGNFNSTGFLFPGTVHRSNVAVTSINDAFPYTIPQKCILNEIVFRVNPNAVLGTNGIPILYANIFSNENVISPIVTLSLTGTTRVISNFNFSKTLSAGDRIYVNICGGGAGGGASNVSSFYSATVDFGLY